MQEAAAVAAPAFGTSRGTARARWSRDGAHSRIVVKMIKYQYFSSRGTAFPSDFSRFRSSRKLMSQCHQYDPIRTLKIVSLVRYLTLYNTVM